MRPVNDKQWQDAVDAAYFVQQLAMAQLYGLLTQGLEINIECCVEILEDGRERGVLPQLESLSVEIGGVVNPSPLKARNG